MRICYTDSFPFPLPPDHRFPLEKYGLLRKRILASDFGKSQHLAIPRAATDEEILRVHDADYWRRMQTGEVCVKEMRRIALEDNTGDLEYQQTLAKSLERIFESFEPELAIYLAGADPYKGDRFGKLALTRQGLVARDRLVFDHWRRAGLPVAVALAGGYARNISDTVDIHFQTVRAALDYGQRVGFDSGGLDGRNRTNQ